LRLFCNSINAMQHLLIVLLLHLRLLLLHLCFLSLPLLL
jgi:hypothetical protein